MVEKRGIPRSDEELAALFFGHLQDPEQSQLSGIGFVVGWLATLANKGLRTREPVSLPAALAESAAGERE